MRKKVLSVGFVFPGGLAEFVDLDAKRSLLDADVVIFRPGVGPFHHLDFQNSHYQGKPNLAEDSSFELKAAASHWRQQIQMALNAGKNVMLPVVADAVVASEGSHMKLGKGATVLADYWAQFGEHSVYKVVFEGLKVTPSVTTAAGDMPVSCMFTMKGARGSVVALPALAEYDVDSEDLEGFRWTRDQKQFGQRLMAALLAVDEALRAGSSATPPPEWASRHDFLLEAERELGRKVLEIDADVEALLARRAEVAKELAAEGQLRRLLYEKGPALEEAILLALQILGFSAQPFANAESEFDAVFVSPEGRFLGEAEGKDGRAINVDKLRQLEMNVQEDFARDGVTEYARGVLFGNAYRLQAPAERPTEFFTDKCRTAAARSGTALVRTTDLFVAAKHAKETADLSYAEACRRALLEQGGKVVEFPQQAQTETPSNNAIPPDTQKDARG